MERNTGLERWEQLRREWNTPTGDRQSTRSGRQKTRRGNSRELFDMLMEESDKPFPRRVPLDQLVDTLIDVWEKVSSRQKTRPNSAPLPHPLKTSNQNSQLTTPSSPNISLFRIPIFSHERRALTEGKPEEKKSSSKKIMSRRNHETHHSSSATPFLFQLAKGRRKRRQERRYC